MIILPSRWAAAYSPLPPGWLPVHAPALLRRLPDFPRLLRQAAEGVGVAEHLLVCRCQLEQSALTYAWNGTSGDYGGGAAGDELKLRYLCGADRTDGGDRPGGWFGPERQLLACALRFRWWYRGKDGPRPEWHNWLGLEEDPAFRPGVPVTRGGRTLTPDNQISADCLRYTTSLEAASRLHRIAETWFPEEFTMSSSLTVLQPTMDSFGAWLKGQKPGHGSVQATVLHHTWSPASQQFAGRSTIEAIRRFHMQTRGWSDIGANAYACPDRMVITGRPLTADNWAHAQVSRPWPQVEAEARALAGGDAGWFNKYAFGLETVANFDDEDPATGTAGRAYATALRVLAVVHQVYGLPPERLFFHRDVADKSCPGRRLDRARVRQELAELLGGGLGIVRLGHPADLLIPCRPEIINGATWIDVPPMAEALGATVIRDRTGWHLYHNGHEVDTSGWADAIGNTWRVPLRQLLGTLGWRVAVRDGHEPDHTRDVPPRIYVEPRPGA